MSNLSVELRNMAREQGLCDKWFGEWKDDSDNSTTLFDKYKQNLISAYLRIILAWSLCAHTGIKMNLKRMEYSWILKNSECKGIKGTFIVNGSGNVNFHYRRFFFC